MPLVLTCTVITLQLPQSWPDVADGISQERLSVSTVAVHATGYAQLPTVCRVIFCPSGSGASSEAENDRLFGVTCNVHGCTTLRTTATTWGLPGTCAPELSVALTTTFDLYVPGDNELVSTLRKICPFCPLPTEPVAGATCSHDETVVSARACQ